MFSDSQVSIEKINSDSLIHKAEGVLDVKSKT